MRRFRRHKRTDLGKEHDKSLLPQQRRLTAHVGAGYHKNLMTVGIEFHTVADVWLARRETAFDYRMAPLGDGDFQRIVDHRTHITVFLRCSCHG